MENRHFIFLFVCFYDWKCQFTGVERWLILSSSSFGFCMPVRRGSKSVHLTILSEQMLGKYNILAFHSFLRTSVTSVKCTRSFLFLGVQCWCFTVL